MSAAQKELPDDGFIRTSMVLKWIPVSTSTWDRWVKAGYAPQPVKLSTRTVAYNVGEIRAFMARLRDKQQPANDDEVGAS